MLRMHEYRLVAIGFWFGAACAYGTAGWLLDSSTALVVAVLFGAFGVAGLVERQAILDSQRRARRESLRRTGQW